MKIAVVGTGIAGNVASYLLAQDHDLTVFERNDYVGGHTHTVSVESPDGVLAVDTGFIVFTDERYPQFVKLLDRLGVPSQPSKMSFGVHCERTGVEYSSHSLFARRRNALRPAFYRMLADVVRFKQAMRSLLLEGDEKMLLGALLEEGGYSAEFSERFLYPMGASIWSADPARMQSFPACFVARFFTNHRFLDLHGQPEWRVVRGGSQRYVEKLTASFRDRIRLSSPVSSIRRAPDHVLVTARGKAPERFDQVIVASHGDEALSMLEDPTDREREILGSFRFQENLAVLHTDERMMPKRRRAWASWNATVPRKFTATVMLTYYMNLLQGLRTRKDYFVTLNRSAEINPARVLRSIRYHHPIFDAGTLAAQRRHQEISGLHHRTHFCGAYWGFGFHEDGVASALEVCRPFERGLG